MGGRCRGQPRHDPGRQHRAAAQHLLDVVGQWARSLLQPDGAGEAGCAPPVGPRQVDADRQPRSQAQFRALGNAHHVAAGAQCVEDAPLADPLEVLGRAGASEDRQPAQLVGLVRRRIREYMGALVLDADHAAGAVGDGLRQPEQVGARAVPRVAAIAVMLEDMVDQPVEAVPTCPRINGDDGDARADGPCHQAVGRLLEEDCDGCAGLPLDPSPGVPVADTEQKERRPRRRRRPPNRAGHRRNR